MLHKVLVTGFEPFGKFSENSSREVAWRVASSGVVGAEVIAERLPVSFTRVGEMLSQGISVC